MQVISFKEQLSQMLTKKAKDLEQRYRLYFDTDGPSKSAAGAAVMRARIKKDLDIVKLVLYLLESCPDDFYIRDADIMDILDKVIR